MVKSVKDLEIEIEEVRYDLAWLSEDFVKKAKRIKVLDRVLEKRRRTEETAAIERKRKKQAARRRAVHAYVPVRNITQR